MSRRDHDNYTRRMAIATGVAAVIHVIILMLLGIYGGLATVNAIGPAERSDEPVVLNLQPEPEGARSFVDTAVPANEEVNSNTDLISDKASKASDLQDSEGERPSPQLDRISDVDDLAGPMTPEPPAPPVAPSPEAVAMEPRPETEEPGDAEDKQAQQEELQALTALARVEETMPPLEEKSPEKPRQQIAQAQPELETAPTPPPQPHLGVSKSRPDGGADGKGFVGFEALEHELGPYMKEVRDRVERNWRAALEMRFSGASRTKAVLDCAISPQGKLVKVKILESGDSPTYALMCKQAIEKSAPFPPFPFDVPAIYRTQNLEIRWTFSYL